MPHGEYGAGDGRHGKSRERSRRKACGKAGILHADLDGKRLRLGCREFQQLAEAKTAAVAEQVMENHDGEHDSARGENLCGIVRDDCGHNHCNRNYGNERQNLHRAGSPLVEKLVELTDLLVYLFAAVRNPVALRIHRLVDHKRGDGIAVPGHELLVFVKSLALQEERRFGRDMP